MATGPRNTPPSQSPNPANEGADQQQQESPRLLSQWYEWFVEPVSKTVLALVIIAGVVVSGIWIYWNKADVHAFLVRVLTSSDEVSIAGVVKVALSKTNSGGPQIDEWAAFHRLSNGLKLNLAHFGEGDGLEYVELEALSRVNLTEGFIGNGKEILYLGEYNIKEGKENLILNTGDVLRIYTYCGPEISPYSLPKSTRNLVWNQTCRNLIDQMDTLVINDESGLSTAINRRNSKKQELIRLLLENYAPGEEENNWCSALYAEHILSKKNYENQILFKQEFWTDKYISESDLKGEFDLDIIKKAKGKKKEAQGGKMEGRQCYEDIAGTRRKAVVARCVSSEFDRDEENIVCLAGLPRFQGIFRADPGEGDRIVIIGNNDQMRLDIDYWWTTRH
jgi:hypothetical protein